MVKRRRLTMMCPLERSTLRTKTFGRKNFRIFFCPKIFSSEIWVCRKFFRPKIFVLCLCPKVFPLIKKLVRKFFRQNLKICPKVFPPKFFLRNFFRRNFSFLMYPKSFKLQIILKAHNHLF